MVCLTKIEIYGMRSPTKIAPKKVRNCGLFFANSEKVRNCGLFSKVSGLN